MSYTMHTTIPLEKTKRQACLKHQSYFAGSAFTDGKCNECGGGILHPNTFTPKWCEKCAEKLGICKYCGDSDELTKKRTR